MFHEESSIEVAFVYTCIQDKLFRFMLNEIANSFLFNERLGNILIFDNKVTNVENFFSVS